MTLNSRETSLVVAAAWNPAILTPAWVLEYGLQRPGSNEPVQIAVPHNTSGLYEFPRYTLPEFSYIVRPDSLIINPASTSEAIARAEDAAAAMLGSLPHTPVTGLGHNFEFQDDETDPENLEVFTLANQDLADEAPEGWTNISTLIASSFRYANGQTIANVQRQFDGDNVVIKFNFHHPITSVQEALEILRGEGGHTRMHQNLQNARNFLTAIYGATQ